MYGTTGLSTVETRVLEGLQRAMRVDNKKTGLTNWADVESKLKLELGSATLDKGREGLMGRDAATFMIKK